MSAEREKTYALRWGLVALGAIVYICLRFGSILFEEVVELLFRADRLVLAARLSQLKPPGFKQPWLSTYGTVLVVLVSAAFLVLLAIGIRDSFREDPPEVE